VTKRLPSYLAFLIIAGCGGDPGDWSHVEEDVSDSFRVARWSDADYEATDMRFLPDGRALLLTKGGWQGEGTGKVELLNADGSRVGTILHVDVCADAERGLLGVEIDPRFDQTGRIFLFYTRQMSGCAVAEIGEQNPAAPVFNRVSSFIFDDGAIDPNSEVVVLDDLPAHQSSHNAGGLQFMPDGTLLVATGEARLGLARDLDSATGKLLRVDVDDPSKAPGDNPFAPADGWRALVFAFGLRNPFRIATSSVDGLTAAADVGTDEYEEINIVASGGDYGFPDVEGPGSDDGSIRPALWYRHVNGCNAVIGGDFVPRALLADRTSTDVDAWLSFSDVGCPAIWAAGIRDGQVVVLLRLTDRLDHSLSHLVLGPDDAMYLVGIGPEPQPVLRLSSISG
jgi:glucose/arabinose dehydrogenase